MSELLRTLRALNTTEELLSYFRIPYDQGVLNIHRIGMLQRAHALLAVPVEEELDDDALYQRLRQLMLQAYAEVEKQGPRKEAPPPAPEREAAFVSLDDVRGVGFTRRN